MSRRILLLTELFPLETEPYGGIFVRNQLAAIQNVDPSISMALYFPRLWGARWLAPLWKMRGRSYPTKYGAPLRERLRIDFRFLPILRLPGWYRPAQSICKSALRMLKKDPVPDLIHAHFLFETGLAACLLGEKIRRSVVITVHGSDVNGLLVPTRHPQILEDSVRALRRANHIVAVSQDLAKKVVDLGADPKKISVIPNGVDENLFVPMDRSAMRKKWSVEKSETVVLFVGNLFESKGIRDLLSASRDQDWTLVFIGEGPLKDSLASESRSKVLGSRSSREIAEWMSVADLFCLPSHSEGLPCVILEALSCGCPVVATRVGGVPELIHAKNGLLVPARDPGALGDALRSCLDKAWDRSKIRDSSEPYRWSTVAPKILEVYRSCMESS